MEGNEQVQGSRRFGSYLKTIRESRKLSLDAVEEMTGSCAERVTKSHLSRIENGLAVPTFPRLLALGQIYGVPIGSLAERFEIELRREKSPVVLGERSDANVLEEVRELRQSGRHSEALMLLLALWDKHGDDSRGNDSEEHIELRLQLIACLTKLGRLETAKQQCEEVLARQKLSLDCRLLALHYFADTCFRLGRLTIAKMALDQADQVMQDPGVRPGPGDLGAYFALLKGNVAFAMSDPNAAAEAYADALRRFVSSSNAFEACRAKVSLGASYGALARSREALELLQVALQDAQTSGYDRLAALALHHLGVITYRSGDYRAAGGHFVRSNGLARTRDYLSLLFGNCFYLWRMAREMGDVPAARAQFRSLRSLVGRVEEALPEVEEFRAAIARGES